MNPYEVYEKYQNDVVSNEDLLIKTFDRIFDKLNQIQLCIEENLIEQKAMSIAKLIDVFEILRSSLDFEAGGEIAKNLDAIYAFCIDELIKANATNEKEYIENIKEILKPVKEGFEEIARQ